MLTQQENESLTKVGPGTPAGELLRRYWQPVALSDELLQGGAPIPLKILGEELVLFRDNHGQVGLLGLHCSHRGADLSYGRVEDGGLRCIYHGWLYDVRGRCLDQPGEPNGGDHRQSICHPAYPCMEKAGLVFAYMGPGEPPLLPNYESLAAPADRRFIRKYFQECSYLQANEGNIDPVHLSFLHRQLKDDLGDRRGGLGVSGTSQTADSLYKQDIVPSLEVEITDFGVRIFAIRKAGADNNFIRVSNFILPNLCAVPGEAGADGYNMNWHVPIDDNHHWKYMLTFRRSGPLDLKSMGQRNAAVIDNAYRLTRNLANRYLQDRNEMVNGTYTGMGGVFPVHDGYATESQGAIQDRTQEHLSSTDIAIVAARKLLLSAINDVQEGREAPHVVRVAKMNKFPDVLVISEVVPSSVKVKDFVAQRLVT
ncbi:MAG: Rieske 2Fe-2S domain-containing protein [Deltaproteobacteria bacterium]|nr:Rieske 2Fe-2S domain-containing protein [Deltaproteobacteria bacterium]